MNFVDSNIEKVKRRRGKRNALEKRIKATKKGDLECDDEDLV